MDVLMMVMMINVLLLGYLRKLGDKRSKESGIRANKPEHVPYLAERP